MLKRFWSGIQKESNIFGFGCWQIAGNHSKGGVPNGWGDVQESLAVDLLSYAMDSGIDFFDTAQGYNSGKSERLLGEAIRATGKSVIVCTKIAITDEEILQKKIGDGFKLRVAQSLKNLGISYIDILLIHNPPDNISWNDFNYDVLYKLVSENIIGTFGISSRGLKGAINAVESNVGTTVEWVLNIFERRPVKDLMPLIEEKKFNLIARSPLSRGLINPIYLSSEPVFHESDFRSTLPKDWIDWVVDSLRLFHANGVSEKDIIRNSLLFCTQFKEVNALVVGIKSKIQLEEYLRITVNSSAYFDPGYLINIPEYYPKWV